MAPKKELEDKLEENKLDLSMMALEKVPVKEIAVLRKGTIVDLSNNNLSVLSPDFVTLTHIMRLDLSKNQLTELPDDFGQMRQLKYLDLYSNKLKHLPLSFSQLHNLRWLDLKNNPLVPALMEVAGDCLDASQCQTAAKKVVALMQNLQKQVERERAKKLEEEKAHEAEQLVLQQKERERVKQEKKAAKERRKAEMLAQKATVKQRTGAVGKVVEKPETLNGVKKVPLAEPTTVKEIKKPSGSYFPSFLIFLLCFWLTGFIIVAVTLWFYTGGNLSASAFQHALPQIQADMKIIMVKFQKKSLEVWDITLHYAALIFNSTVVYVMEVCAVISEKVTAVWRFLAENSGDTILVLVNRTGHYWTVTSTWASEMWKMLQKAVPVYLEILKEKVWAFADSTNSTIQNFINPGAGKT